VRALHSYETPEIIALPIVAGSVLTSSGSREPQALRLSVGTPTMSSKRIHVASSDCAALSRHFRRRIRDVKQLEVVLADLAFGHHDVV
jgi:hypothetical protein